MQVFWVNCNITVSLKAVMVPLTVKLILRKLITIRTFLNIPKIVLAHLSLPITLATLPSEERNSRSLENVFVVTPSADNF
jgi:hypothetical protein